MSNQLHQNNQVIPQVGIIGMSCHLDGSVTDDHELVTSLGSYLISVQDQQLSADRLLQRSAAKSTGQITAPSVIEMKFQFNSHSFIGINLQKTMICPGCQRFAAIHHRQGF